MKSEIVHRIFIKFIKAAWSDKNLAIIVLNNVFIQILYTFSLKVTHFHQITPECYVSFQR